MVSAPDNPDEPLFAGSLLGLRAWNVIPAGAGGEQRLSGVYVEAVWAAGEWTRAHCDGAIGGGGHAAPQGSCSCGLYAYHPRIEPAFELYFEHAPDGPSSWSNPSAALPSVYGVVEAAGRVEVHAHGFRAERCRPVALVCTAEWSAERRRLLERLAAASGAEVLEVDRPEDIVRWCERRGGVLEESTVRELLVPGVTPIAGDPPPRPPASGWDRVREVASRIGEAVVLAVVGLISIAWYGSLAALGVFFVGALLFGWADEEPKPLPAHVAKAWVDRDDCSVHVVIRARRELPRLVMRVTGRGPDGAGLGHFQRELGRLAKGRSRIELAQAPRGLCRKEEEFTLRVRTVWPHVLGPVSELRSLPSGNAGSGRPHGHEPSRTLPHDHRRAGRGAGHRAGARARAGPGPRAR